jgi:hypothetical protein
MLNSNHIQRKIQRSWKLRKQIEAARGNRPEMIRNVYLAILSRYPTPDELRTAEKYFETGRSRQGETVDDLAWTLVNTKEFLYRH